jgi:uncharacterized RDD family membrane protein YckC
METTSQAFQSETTYPSLSDRVQSMFIDSIVIVVLMLIAASWLEKYDNAPDWIRIALFFGFWAIYEPLCITIGGTIGNIFKGIRVRQLQSTNKKINFLMAFVRYVIKMCLGWLSFLTIHTNKEKRAIHDLVVGSVMIKK